MFHISQVDTLMCVCVLIFLGKGSLFFILNILRNIVKSTGEIYLSHLINSLVISVVVGITIHIFFYCRSMLIFDKKALNS